MYSVRNRSKMAEHQFRRHQVDMMFNGPDRPTFMPSQNNIIILFNKPDRPNISALQNNNNMPIEK